MWEYIKSNGKYFIYALFTNIIFGAIYYLVFWWLIRYSLLYAYFGCLLLIFIGLWLDKQTLEYITSDKLIVELKGMTQVDKKKNSSLIKWIFKSYVSFKTILFIFYFVIIIVSQIINIAPDFVGKDISNFVMANSYGIVLLLAWDRIKGQFAKDREEMEEKAISFEKQVNEEGK